VSLLRRGPAAAALVVLGLLGFLAAGCGSTTTVTVTSAVPQVDRATGDKEPLRFGAASGVRCGVELWPLKTLIDPNSGQVQLDPVLPTSIAAVNALPPPSDPTTRQGDNFELHAYRVTDYLVGYKLEADNDWHIVLSDDGSESSGHTMIVEIPNPACAEPPLEPVVSRVLAQITQARAAFESAFPPANACFSCNLKTQVTVIGVGFFDKLHGQHGVAVNGAELHPVIGFQLGGGPPPVTTTTSSTTTEATPTSATTTAPTTAPSTTSTTTPPTTAPAATGTAPVTTTPKQVPTPPPSPEHGKGCNLYPGRHWYRHRYHTYCRPFFFFTKYGAG
jgi:hypothetical protein